MRAQRYKMPLSGSPICRKLDLLNLTLISTVFIEVGVVVFKLLLFLSRLIHNTHDNNVLQNSCLIKLGGIDPFDRSLLYF